MTVPGQSWNLCAFSKTFSVSLYRFHCDMREFVLTQISVAIWRHKATVGWLNNISMLSNDKNVNLFVCFLKTISVYSLIVFILCDVCGACFNFQNINWWGCCEGCFKSYGEGFYLTKIPFPVLNSLWPNDAKWHQTSWSLLAWLMACSHQAISWTNADLLSRESWVHRSITPKFVTPTAPSCIDNSWRSTTLPAADSNQTLPFQNEHKRVLEKLR